MQKYKCEVCGYIYNPEEGDTDARIAPNTPFGALPDSWECPICGEGKKSFSPLKEEGRFSYEKTRVV